MISSYLIASHYNPILGWFGIQHVCWVPSQQISSGGRLLVPLGIRLQKEAQMLMLIMERKASGNYRGSERNSGDGARFYPSLYV